MILSECEKDFIPKNILWERKCQKSSLEADLDGEATLTDTDAEHLSSITHGLLSSPHEARQLHYSSLSALIVSSPAACRRRRLTGSGKGQRQETLRHTNTQQTDVLQKLPLGNAQPLPQPQAAPPQVNGADPARSRGAVLVLNPDPDQTGGLIPAQT